MSTLGKAAKFISGGTPKKGVAEYWNGDIPWYSASNMDRRFLSDGEPKITKAGLETGSRLAPRGATLLLVRGSGLFNHIPICFADQPVAFNQDVKAICARQHVDPTFLHFWIETLRKDLSDNLGVTGIGAGKFDTDFLKALPFPDISKKEQEKIGLIASSFDRRIDLNRRMNETLERLARVIFRDWFVDFGPTRAKLEGLKPYLAPKLWSLFPDRLDSKGKPEGWGDGTIRDIVDLNPESWSTRTPPQYVEYVDLANTKWGTIENTELHQWDAAPSRARRILRTGDTIVGTVRPGNGSYAFVGCEGLTGSTGFAVLRPKKQTFRELIYCAATSKENIERLAHIADGGAYPAVRPDVVADTELCHPHKEVLEKFSEICAPLFDRMEANKRESRSLTQCRNLILPKLMSRAISIMEVQRQVGVAP